MKKKMNIVIRHGKLADLQQIEGLQQQLVVHERPFDAIIPKKGKVPYYDIKKMLRSRNARFFVAIVDSNIVGCVFGQIRKNPSWSLDKKFGYVGLMIVDKKFRNQHIGELLMQRVLAWFAEKNMPRATLHAYAENHTALQAYKKYGFKEFIVQMKYERK